MSSIPTLLPRAMPSLWSPFADAALGVVPWSPFSSPWPGKVAPSFSIPALHRAPLLRPLLRAHDPRHTILPRSNLAATCVFCFLREARDLARMLTRSSPHSDLRFFAHNAPNRPFFGHHLLDLERNSFFLSV